MKIVDFIKHAAEFFAKMFPISGFEWTMWVLDAPDIGIDIELAGNVIHENYSFEPLGK
jgi:hypothetical protein